MLREGLGAEFPIAARALASIPRGVVVSREDPRWAAVSAFGAAWLVGVAGNALATLPRAAGFRDPASWLAGAVAITDPLVNLALGLGLSGGSMVAAGAVIRARAASRRPLIAFAVIVAVLWLGTQWPFIWDIVRGAYEVRSPVPLYGVILGPVNL